MVYNHHIAKKKPKPKKPQAQTDKERNTQYLDLIHAKKEINLYNAKLILGWGDGVFYRRTRDLKEAFTGEVEYLKKDKKFVSIAKPITLTNEALTAWNQEPEEKSISEQNRAILSV